MVRVQDKEKPWSPFYLSYNGDFKQRSAVGKATSDPSFNLIGQGPDVVPHLCPQVSFGGFCPSISGDSIWSYAKTKSIFHLNAEFLINLIPHLLYFR